MQYAVGEYKWKIQDFMLLHNYIFHECDFYPYLISVYMNIQGKQIICWGANLLLVANVICSSELL